MTELIHSVSAGMLANVAGILLLVGLFLTVRYAVLVKGRL